MSYCCMIMQLYIALLPSVSCDFSIRYKTFGRRIGCVPVHFPFTIRLIVYNLSFAPFLY